MIDADLDEALLRREAPQLAGGVPFDIHVKATTLSTNDDIRALAAEGASEGTIVFAEEQTAGRGRRGNVWEASSKRCLLFSLLLRPKDEPALWPRATHLAALAVCRAIEQGLPELSPQVKWPNDVMLSGRKVSGILLESAASAAGGFLVLGVGMNVNLAHNDFPVELQSTATSLMLEAGQSMDRNQMALQFLKAFSGLYPHSLRQFDDALAEVHSRSNLLGKLVTLRSSSGPTSGIVSGFGRNGELVLKAGDGSENVVTSGELVRVVSA